MLKKVKQSMNNLIVDVLLTVAKRSFYHPVRYFEHAEIKESAEFLSLNFNGAALFDSKKGGYFQFLMKEVQLLPEPGLWLEFGVREGASAKFFSKYARSLSVDQKLYGFDSFLGIRDSWSWINKPTGSFSTQGRIPNPIPGVEFIVGWVEDTLESFLKSKKEKISFVHFDLDTYAPTKYALQKIIEHLTPGAIIAFDEFYGYPGWKLNEKRALDECLSAHQYQFIAFSRKQAAIKFI